MISKNSYLNNILNLILKKRTIFFKIFFILLVAINFSCSSKIITDQIRGGNIKGPYYLEKYPVSINSEKISIVTFKIEKDINKPIKEVILKRNEDYKIDYDKGTIIFTKDIEAYDKELNKIYILVQYQGYGFNLL